MNFEKTTDAFYRIRIADDNWRRDVFRGERPFSLEDEKVIQDLYRGLRNENDKAAAEQVLATWQSPVVSPWPSFRKTIISIEGTKRLKELFPELFPD